MAQSKVVRYKKPMRSGIIWKLAFVLIVVYIIVLSYDYLTKEHISIYEVTEAKIADDTTLEGIILRQEQVVATKKAGYINYYNPAGNKIGIGDIVCTIDGTGNISDVLADIDNSAKVTIDEIANMRNVISNFQQNFDLSHYKDAYDYQYDVQNAVFEQSKTNLYSDLEKALQKSGQAGTFRKVRAKNAGIISYTVDGMENLASSQITMDMFQNSESLNKTQLRENKTVEQGGMVYKLITSENWVIVLPISEDYVQKLQDKTVIRITVKKDNLSFNADLALENRDGQNWAILKVGRFMQNYMNDRFLEIELNINSAEGLKVPNSSLLKKKFFAISQDYLARAANGSIGFNKIVYDEQGKQDYEYISVDSNLLNEGNYYVPEGDFKAGDTIIQPSTGKQVTVGNSIDMEGVYCVNEGYCKFVRVEKTYQNAEYTIVDAATKGGLSVYDHIVVEPTLLKEDDFIQ